MGGLKNDLPLTYWTFLIGALAIAGVPGLAGFFSKDEILHRAYAGHHTLLWSIGLLTSFITAAYMFRLVFLAFHGERRSAHRHLHDAPRPMALALVVLAVGSVAAGYVGLAGRFEQFLEPSLGRVVEEESAGLELALMVLSSGVAFAGIGLAAFFFLRRQDRARELAERFGGLHRLLVNKYYVDEVYDAAIVQPVRIVSAEGLWKRFDVDVIDRVVNGVASSLYGMGSALRYVQTGSVRAYAASIFVGVVAILGYYLWL
jgi:NADH-quinone oxidoreductase subunit L